MSASNKIYFENLDSVRFIAALTVYLQHGISNSYKYLPIKGTYLEKFLNVISSGGTGVSIFFVLSGFLITYLLMSEFQVNSKISILNFYMRRVIRIWPLYFAVILFSFFVYPFWKYLFGFNNSSNYNIWLHFSFLSNFDVINIIKCCYSQDAMSRNITWSVSVEEQFYLFWPLIFVLFPKRTWFFLILSVIVGAMVFRIINHSDKVVLYFHSLSVMLDLGIGGLFAYLCKEKRRFKLFFENCSTRNHFLFFSVSFCLLYLSSSVQSFEYGIAIYRFFLSVSFALIISAQAFTKKNSILNLKNLTLAKKWGKYTYGIYLIHPIIITLLYLVCRELHISMANFVSSFLVGLIGFILTLIVSRLSFKYYESKFLILKKKFERRLLSTMRSSI